MDVIRMFTMWTRNAQNAVIKEGRRSLFSLLACDILINEIAAEDNRIGVNAR